MPGDDGPLKPFAPLNIKPPADDDDEVDEDAPTVAMKWNPLDLLDEEERIEEEEKRKQKEAVRAMTEPTPPPAAAPAAGAPAPAPVDDDEDDLPAPPPAASAAPSLSRGLPDLPPREAHTDATDEAPLAERVPADLPPADEFDDPTGEVGGPPTEAEMAAAHASAKAHNRGCLARFTGWF